MKRKLSQIRLTILVASLTLFWSFGRESTELAYADRQLNYSGQEQTVYVRPGEPTQITFPSKIALGYKPKNAPIGVEKGANHLVVFAQPNLAPEGTAIIVHLDDKRTYNLRIAPPDAQNPRDDSVRINDTRDPSDAYLDEDAPAPTTGIQTIKGFAPPNTVPGLMREMILHAEFGKIRGIPGYRRTNLYSGEVVLQDGSIVAEIDEMFLGSNYWGYVLRVENLLETTQRLNPATFRLDGTKAVTFQRTELAPRPQTAEQNIAQAHRTKVYIVTRSKRR